MAKRLLYNGYKDKCNRICTYCGRPYAERHEIFGGSNRQISIKHRFQIDVCRDHHRELQDNITDWGQSENLRLRQMCESNYLKEQMNYGATKSEAVRNWMQLIGKNYLDDVMPE